MTKDFWINILLALLSIPLTAYCLSAQYSPIYNSDFEQALVDLGIDTEGLVDGQILTTDADAVTYLDVSNRGLTDLDDLIEFDNVRTLRCSNNAVNQLFVYQMDSLETLIAAGNNCQSVFLAANTALRMLNLRSNNIDTLDLTYNTALEHLDLGFNNLDYLDISHNGQLTYLDLTSNDLPELDVSFNPLLETLYCNVNNITTLDVSSNPMLTLLDAGSNQLTSIDLSANTQLHTLTLLSNDFTSLDVSANSQLTTLTLAYTPLESIDLTGLSDLSSIRLEFSQVIELDLTQNGALSYVNVRNTPLTAVDLRNGNNTFLSTFQSLNSPNLLCVSVDDIPYAEQNWTQVDPWTIFSTSCDGSADCSAFTNAPVDLTKSFDPVDGVQDRVQVKWFKASPQVRYSDEDAAMCDIKFWPKRDLDPVTGNPIGPAYVAPDTTFINDKVKTYPDGSPREFFKWPIKFRADGANNTKRADPNIRYEWQVRCECGHDGNGQESPWSEIKIFNTPDFDPNTGVYTPSPEQNAGNLQYKVLDIESLEIYPNPVNGAELTLRIPAGGKGSYTLEVIDARGQRVVWDTTLDSKAETGQVDISHLIPGTYLMRVIHGVSIYQQRFVVTH